MCVQHLSFLRIVYRLPEYDRKYFLLDLIGMFSEWHFFFSLLFVRLYEMRTQVIEMRHIDRR
ncbi:unnamed protein product [Phytomonas sp. EM1]|nr:unnamed protein product [Phytomonas sp. EM1]|eukprot:CCW65160.1 unnamed protein product [Phytomonas sp. isolate EM1]